VCVCVCVNVCVYMCVCLVTAYIPSVFLVKIDDHSISSPCYAWLCLRYTIQGPVIVCEVELGGSVRMCLSVSVHDCVCVLHFLTPMAASLPGFQTESKQFHHNKTTMAYIINKSLHHKQIITSYKTSFHCHSITSQPLCHVTSLSEHLQSRSKLISYSDII
jgi:hypothetical protein